jgi:uncharacterized repeat protein (TIGR01451 family)
MLFTAYIPLPSPLAPILQLQDLKEKYISPEVIINMRMRRYLAVIIILLSANLAASFAPGDIEWASGVSGTLNKGGTLINGEYMVKAVQFPSPVPGVKDIHGNIVPETDVPPSVLIEIYKNGVLLNTQILSPGSEPYIDPDYEAKVTATGFPASNARGWVYEYYTIEPPWATISIQKRGLPKLDVTVTTDKSAYTSYDDSIITATATVTNSGGARAKNVDLYLNIGELQLRGGVTGQLHQYYSTLEAGASQSFSVILVVPQLLDQKSYTMSANAKGLDAKDLEYNATTSPMSITVSPKQNYFTISKAVSKDRIYLNETINVRITVTNGGMYDVYNISVNDSMDKNFELSSNTSFQWNIPPLKPEQEWSTSYSIKPREININGFSLPAASTQFTVNNRPYSASSQIPSVIVNGPKIILNKTVDKPVVKISENVTVNVSINNVGDIATKRVEVNDSLPEGVSLITLSDGVSLVNGTISLVNTSLGLNTPVIFNYTIRMNKEGEIRLPSAVANYIGIEYRGTTRSVLSSERPIITVINPSKITSTPAGTPTATETVSSTQTTTPEKTEESFSQKIIRALKELFHEPTANPQPTGTPEPTPTPITPGFDVVFAVIVLVIAALYRHK